MLLLLLLASAEPHWSFQPVARTNGTRAACSSAARRSRAKRFTVPVRVARERPPAGSREGQVGAHRPALHGQPDLPGRAANRAGGGAEHERLTVPGDGLDADRRGHRQLAP